MSCKNINANRNSRKSGNTAQILNANEAKRRKEEKIQVVAATLWHLLAWLGSRSAVALIIVVVVLDLAAFLVGQCTALIKAI